MAFTPFGKDVGPSMNPRPSPLPPFGHIPRAPSPTRPTSGPPTQRAPPPLAFQNPSHSSGQPYRLGGIQSGTEDPRRFLSPDLAYQPAQHAGMQKPIQVLQNWGDGSSSFSKYHAEQSLTRHPVGASYVVSRRSGTDAAEIGRSQDPRGKSHSVLPTDQSSFFPPRKQSPVRGFENVSFVNDMRPLSSHTWKRSPSSAEDNLARFKNNPDQLTGHYQSLNSSHADSHDAAERQDSMRRKFSPVATSHRIFQDKPKLGQNESRRLSTSPPALDTRSNIPSRNLDSLVLGQSSSAIKLLDHTSRTSSSPAAKRTRSPPQLLAEKVVQGNSGPSHDGTEREDQAKAKRLARFKGELENIPVQPVITRYTKSSVKSMKALDIKEKKYNPLQSIGDSLKGEVLSGYESSEPSSVVIGLCPDMCPESERKERERKGDLDQYERVDGDRNQTSEYLAVKKYNRTAEREAILIRPMPILQKTMDYLLSLLDQPYDDSFLGMYNFLWDRMRAIRMDLRMQHIFNQEAITMLEKMIRLHIIAMHELCEYTKGEGFSEGFDAHLNIEQMNKTSVELFQMYDDHRKKGISVPTEKEYRGYYALLKLDKHPGYKVEPAELSLDLAKMTPETRQTSEVLFARDVARACRTSNFIAFFRLARKASYLQACLMHAHFSKLRTQALASLHLGLLNNQGLPVSDVSTWIGMEEEDIEALLEYHGFSIKEFEEPYMMKDGPFLHADLDYPTTCSKLVHLKKSRTILEDVSAESPWLSSIEAAKESWPSTNTSKHDAPPTQTLRKQTSLHVVDQEMLNSKTSLSPKGSKPDVPLIMKPMVDQDQDYPSKAAGSNPFWKFSSPCGSPRFQLADTCWKFSSPHGSPRFLQAETQSMEKPCNDIHFDIFPGVTKFPFVEAVPTDTVSGPALQQSSLMSMPRQIIARTSTPLPPSHVENEYASEGLEPETVLVNSEEDSRNIEQENEDGLVVNQFDEEVAVAKLKLIIRLWKRWSSRQREFRERRQLAASAALNSLSLGPPIRLIKDDKPRTAGEFDLDQAMRKRSRKHEQSWSRLNISEVVADILSRRNPDYKCLCWKVILCTQKKSTATTDPIDGAMHSAVSQWLLSKLMPCNEDGQRDDYMLLLSGNVSVWNKWVAKQSSLELTCCLSVVRDVEVDNDLHKVASGASAVLFLASEGIPWNLQRDQLKSVLMSVPSGSCLPLLVISSSYNSDGNRTNIADLLGLHDIDRSRVSGFSVVSLIDKTQMWGREDQFFSDKQLREGLRWLASKSPLQPTLHCIHPRELALTHLSFLLELLKKMPNQEVSPNLCISAFNDALDQSLGNIASAAEANPFGWPCPEIELLEDWRTEHVMVKYQLPTIGWSTSERIQRLKSVLNDCKLPSFQDDLTWLTIDCGLGGELENQRQRLESCLVEYLTETSNLMGVTLAVKEAGAMLQRNTRLELHNSNHRIIPRWISIFQRIFNWRLMGLNNAKSSSAYVLKSDLPMPAASFLNKLVIEDELCRFFPPNLPSLDEMIDASFSPIKSPPRNHGVPLPLLDHEAKEAPDMDETRMEKKIEVPGRLNLNAADETESRLGELLEKCNIVQNGIAQKLSIYF